MLALVAAGGAVYGRWIELARGGLAWGGATRALGIAEDHAVLAPGGRELAGLRGDLTVVVDLAAPAARARPVCGGRGLRRGGGAIAIPLAFVGRDGVIACKRGDRVVWWDPARAAARADAVVTSDAIAAGPDGLVAGHGVELALVAPGATRYLGYRVRVLAHLRAGPAGLLIGTGGGRALLLDARLGTRVRYELGDAGGAWTDLVALDARHLLGALEVADERRYVLHDRVTRAATPLPHPVRDGALRFEPATRLLVVGEGRRPTLVRYDPAAGAFRAPVAIELGFDPTQLYLVDPALARGVAALALRDDRGGTRVAEIRAEDLGGASVRPRRTYRIPRGLRAVDRAGRLYVSASDDAVAVYTGDTETATLPGLGGLALRPSPDATRVAGHRDGRVAVVTTDGRAVWETAVWGVEDLAWLASGALIARTAGALVELDRDTGALGERRCGWELALVDEPHGGGPDLSSLLGASGVVGPVVCDAP